MHIQFHRTWKFVISRACFFPQYFGTFITMSPVTTSNPSTAVLGPSNVPISPRPLYKIPVRCSDHPLELSILSEHKTKVTSLYQQFYSSPNAIITSVFDNQIPGITHSHFHEMVSYDSPIKDSIIHQFLITLKSSSPNIFFLDTNFHRDLIDMGGILHTVNTFYILPVSSLPCNLWLQLFPSISITPTGLPLLKGLSTMQYLSFTLMTSIPQTP